MVTALAYSPHTRRIYLHGCLESTHGPITDVMRAHVPLFSLKANVPPTIGFIITLQLLLVILERDKQLLNKND